MKLVAYRHGRARGVGIIDAGAIQPLVVTTLQELLDRRPVDRSLAGHASDCASGSPLAIDEVELLAPIGNSGRNVFAIGWNYLAHFDEGRAARGDEPDLPDHPAIFTMTPQSIVGPSEAIEIDSGLSERWDYEAEVAIVIGTSGRNISVDEAQTHIAGFTLANDVTARDVQRQHGGQWFKGKSLDSSTPVGPWLVTADELDRGRPGSIELTVNGEVRQSASTAQMYFDFARIIAELSAGLTLLRGDVILTGTPAGVGYARTPPVFLHDGDLVVVRSPELGELRNPVMDRAVAVAGVR